MVDRLGFTLHQIFLLDGALSLASGVMLSLFLREVRPQDPPTAPVLALVGRALRLVFTTRVTVMLFTIMSLTFLATQTAAPFFPLLVRRLHPDAAGLATAIGLVFGVSTLVGALLSPIAGVLGDRYGFQRVLVVAASAGAISLVAMPFAPSLMLLAVAALVFGAASATATAMVIAQLAMDLPDDRRSVTLNLVYVPLYLGGILGGVLGALLVQAGLGLVMIVSALLMLAGAALALRRRSSSGA
jgi:MFS family permease